MGGKETSVADADGVTSQLLLKPMSLKEFVANVTSFAFSDDPLRFASAFTLTVGGFQAFPVSGSFSCIYFTYRAQFTSRNTNPGSFSFACSPTAVFRIPVWRLTFP